MPFLFYGEVMLDSDAVYPVRRKRGKSHSMQRLKRPKTIAPSRVTATTMMVNAVEHMVFIRSIILNLLSAFDEDTFNP